MHTPLPLANLKSRTIDLRNAANEHDEGDLFIEDETSKFGNAVTYLERDEKPVQVTRQLQEADATARRLTAIVAADVARQRVDTIEATTLAYDVRQNRVHRTRDVVDAAQKGSAPFCSEPAIFARPVYRHDEGTQASSNPRSLRLRNRMDAARAADPTSVLDAITALNDAEMRLLENRGNADDAAQAASSRERLTRVADTFIHSSIALGPQM